MSYSASWLGSGVILYEDGRGMGENDKPLLDSLWNLLNQADYVIAHNGRKFDCGKINARFIQHDMLPPSPYRIIDTLEIARKSFNFTSNKLQYLADALKCAPKQQHGKFPGFELWNECMRDNEEA
jgi:DNA polymerase III epsilon subunit-like protein